MPVTANIYQRVLRVVLPDGTSATGFTLDREGVQYLITAEHVVAAQPGQVRMILHGSDWKREVALERILGVTGGADIAIFRLEAPLTPQLPIDTSFDSIVYTQEVYFLGYPYGLGLQRTNVPLLPFVKHGILSASAETPEGGHVMYLDGFNNPGFSGGPVAFYALNTNQPHICGVVSGYRTDNRRVRVGNQEIDATVLENTGIVIAYDIMHALEAI